MSRGRIIGASAMVLSALVVQACTSTSGTTAKPAATTETAALTPVLSVRELMEHVIDPTADWIYDAAVVDVTAKGTVHTMPVSDEEWLKVERGVLLLAESANLLKMPRAVAPPGTPVEAGEPGKPLPELPPAEIEAKIKADTALWNKHADDLRIVAMASLPVIKTKNAEALFKIGNDINNACEACHLEYWYPGDKKFVLEDQKKTVTYDPPKK